MSFLMLDRVLLLNYPAPSELPLLPGAHLAHAHVVAEGALDDGRVVVDIEDGDPQGVLLPPRGHAAVRGLDLWSGGVHVSFLATVKPKRGRGNAVGARLTRKV